MSQTPVEKAASLMVPATIYCNIVDWGSSQLGLRLAFGEESIMQGQPATYRTAVFIPMPLVRHVLEALLKSWGEHEQKMQAAAEAQTQQKQ
jgi:hypothetical protein